jgi:mannosyltransferase OCH1-like enzyme
MVSWEFISRTIYPFLEDLGETVHTYVNFHKVKSEYDIAFKYHVDTMPANADNALVPKILHHIWLQEHGDGRLETYEESRNTCTAMHKSEDGWQHWLWTEDVATEWVHTQYPELYKNYTSYAQTIQRSNILRYLILHHYGGIYLDLDLTCRQPLDEFLHAPFLTSSTSKWPVGINNAFILSRPQHPFLDHLIQDERIQSRARDWPSPWLESMMTTGFMFLSNAWMDYVELHKHLSYRDSVFVLADNHGKYAEHALGGKANTPLFEHARAGSWHAWDASIVLFVERHPNRAIAGLVLVVFAWIVSMFLGCCGRPRLCKGRNHRERQEKQWNVRRDVVEARKKRTHALHSMERRRRQVLPSHHTTPTPTRDALSRFLAALAPSQGASLPDGTYLRDSNDSIAPISLPPRSGSYPGSHAGRTSSIMIPPRNTGYGGRPSSIYDFAY